MPKMTPIQQLAKLADGPRRNGGSLEVNYRKGGREGTLTQIEWGRLPSGQPTKREITCLDNGEAKRYDKSYELEPTTVVFIDPEGLRGPPLPAKFFLE